MCILAVQQCLHRILSQTQTVTPGMPFIAATMRAAKKSKSSSGDAMSSTDMDVIGEMVRTTMTETLGEQFEKFKASFRSHMEALFSQKLQEMQTALTQKFAEEKAAMEAKHAADRDALTNRITTLEAAVETTQRSFRANNLVLHGLMEPADQNGPSLQDTIRTLLETSGDAPRTPHQITSIQRLGKPRTAASDRPRPVRITFTDTASKIAALKRCKDLRQRQLYLDTDLTPKQQQMRNSKRDRYHLLKNTGMRPFWRAERLMVIRDGVAREDDGADIPAAAAPSASA